MKLCILFLSLILALAMVPGCSGSSSSDGGTSDDPLLQACIDQGQGSNPWCYVDQLIATGDPDRCEDVLDHWNDEDKGMVGECYFQIAQNTDDCNLCDRIEKSDLRESCRLQLCN